MRELLTTNRFVWLHTPKTGGTWLHGILVKHSPPEWQLVGKRPSHVRLREVPGFLVRQGVSERADLPTIASVRNPWDCYVSLYFWMEGHCVRRTGGFSVHPDQWSSDCAGWAKHISCGLGIDGFRRALPRLVERVPDEHAGFAPRQELFIRSGDSVGVTHLVRFENLRAGFLDALAKVVPEIPAPMRRAIVTGTPENSSYARPAYPECYDAELRRIVAETHGWLIETCKYEFGT